MVEAETRLLNWWILMDDIVEFLTRGTSLLGVIASLQGLGWAITFRKSSSSCLPQKPFESAYV